MRECVCGFSCATSAYEAWQSHKRKNPRERHGLIECLPVPTNFDVGFALATAPRRRSRDSSESMDSTDSILSAERRFARNPDQMATQARVSATKIVDLRRREEGWCSVKGRSAERPSSDRPSSARARTPLTPSPTKRLF